MSARADNENRKRDPAAPPADGGADDDIEFVDAPRPWVRDDEGYPPGPGLEPVGLPPRFAAGDDGAAEADGDPEASDRASLFAGAGAHLDELRKRATVSLLAFVPLFALGLWLYRDLWRLVILPLDRAAPHLLRFQALGPSDGLVMAMRIAFAFALFLSLPVWLSQAWRFAAPGLTPRERRWLHLALGSGGGLFAMGAALAYLVGVPFALEYLLPFNQSLAGWENAFTGSGYVDFVITCCAGFGLAFELPLVMLVLGWTGVLTPEGIRAWRRPVILAIFILAAVMTPPDPFTQLMLAVPMLALFFLGSWLVKWTARGRRKD